MIVDFSENMASSNDIYEHHNSHIIRLHKHTHILSLLIALTHNPTIVISIAELN